MSKSKYLRVKLIFNPTAGKPKESSGQLLEILTAMQHNNIAAEVHVLDGSQGIKSVIKRAKEDGTKLIVSSGGDGTVDAVAAELAGSDLTLGILPTGTANNLALNLRIPRDLGEAVSLLRNGKETRVDLGQAQGAKEKRYFLELVTIGLLSDIFPSADQIRRGDLSRTREFVSMVAESTPSLITIQADGKKAASLSAYSVVVANMPYIGSHFRIDRKVNFKDKHLDIFVFTALTKAGLVNYAVSYLNGDIDDETVKHFRVKKATIGAHPAMAISLDGQPLEGAKVTIKAAPGALRVMAGTHKGHGPRRADVPELIKSSDAN
jgi:YegS/Rv2252/BmrU family lipid kinase